MSVSRRDFVKSAGATVATVAVASPLAAAVHTGHREELRIGIIGCGGRGSGASGPGLARIPHLWLITCGM